MANNPKAADNLKPFKKGDPRINRKGKPRNMPALRELTLDILHEPATGPDGQLITANGKPVTKVEAIVRAAVQSKDPRQRQWAIELGYGKVPNPVEVTGTDGGPVEYVQRVQELTDSELERIILSRSGARAAE